MLSVLWKFEYVYLHLELNHAYNFELFTLSYASEFCLVNSSDHLVSAYYNILISATVFAKNSYYWETFFRICKWCSMQHAKRKDNRKLKNFDVVEHFETFKCAFTFWLRTCNDIYIIEMKIDLKWKFRTFISILFGSD